MRPERRRRRRHRRRFDRACSGGTRARGGGVCASALTPRAPGVRYKALTEALAELLEDYNLINFQLLCITVRGPLAQPPPLRLQARGVHADAAVRPSYPRTRTHSRGSCAYSTRLWDTCLAARRRWWRGSTVMRHCRCEGGGSQCMHDALADGRGATGHCRQILTAARPEYGRIAACSLSRSRALARIVTLLVQQHFMRRPRLRVCARAHEMMCVRL